LTKIHSDNRAAVIAHKHVPVQAASTIIATVCIGQRSKQLDQKLGHESIEQ
jgi:hypothetical protein